MAPTEMRPAMSDITPNQYAPRRHRRFWLTEAFLVAGILVFGGFALFSDERVTPGELISGLVQVVDR
jgi:hypothetical protein